MKKEAQECLAWIEELVVSLAKATEELGLIQKLIKAGCFDSPVPKGRKTNRKNDHQGVVKAANYVMQVSRVVRPSEYATVAGVLLSAAARRLDRAARLGLVLKTGRGTYAPAIGKNGVLP